ncbi:SDR family oxidoreductase [Candidatus Sumerlaeota bacterium]|nr:SDR family oxidoreductase [Candidatus Sumerlaeota bacterium]
MPTALVTGASGGIGAAICKELKDRGYRVIGIDRASGECMADELFLCDLRDIHRSACAVDDLKKRVGLYANRRLDLLVNNAAWQVVKKVDLLTREDWDDTMSVNFSAPFFLTQAFLPELEAARGSVINIGSIHASLTKPAFVAYATSKGALLTMTRALAVEMGPRGVRVNAILPAATDTPMLRAGFEGNEAAYRKLGEVHPLQRIGTPEEVARLVTFLASGEAAFINGAALGIDGGISSVLHDP